MKIAINKDELKEYLQSHTNEEAAEHFGVGVRTIVRRREEYGFDHACVHYGELVPLTSEQDQILTGCMLGDGGIHKKHRKLQLGQAQYRKEYVDWLYNAFKPYSQHSYMDYSNKDFPSWRFYTIPHEIFAECRQRWYRDTKIVPSDLVLTDLTLTHWIVQDGTNNQPKRAISIATNCFTQEEVEFLKFLLLKDLKIEATINKSGSTQYVLHIGAYEYFKVNDILKKYVIWNCFDYKVDTSKVKLKENEAHGAYKLNKEKAFLIRKAFDDGVKVKELAIEYNVGIMSIYNVINNITYCKRSDTAEVAVVYSP